MTGASMKSRELRELHDLVEALLDLLAREAEHDAVDDDVLAPRDLGMEAGPQLDQGRDAPARR